MAIEIKLPELGESVEGGDVVDVKVTVGASVREGQSLLEVEAEKSTVDVPSPAAGQISKVLVKKGDSVKTGQTLFVMEPQGAAPRPRPQPHQPPKVSRRLPPHPVRRLRSNLL